MLFRNKSKTFLRFLLIENGLDMLITAMEEAHIRQQIHFRVRLHILHAKLLQKSEMRKDIVIELSYKGFG